MGTLQIQDVFEPYYVGRKPFQAGSKSQLQKLSAPSETPEPDGPKRPPDRQRKQPRRTSRTS
jgi:hypothetical protein